MTPRLQIGSAKAPALQIFQPSKCVTITRSGQPCFAGRIIAVSVSAQNRSTLTHTVGSRATKNQPAPYMPPSWALVHPQSNSKLGLLQIDNEVTFVTHTSATDVFDPEDHNNVMDSPTAATSVLVINPG